MYPEKKVLIVEDDLNLGFLLVEFLENEHFSVKLCKDGQMGLQAVERYAFDLCLLDVMMPRMDGFTLAGHIRKLRPEMPFLFLTAKSRKEDMMKGYERGAEDYITKPFDEDELLCKIKVILRRSSDPEPPKEIPRQFRIGSFQFHYDLQELRFREQVIRITEKENEVLRLLCLHKNRILRRDEAVEQIYGQRDYFLGRSFDVFISRLRKILKNDPNVCIENVFKVGFILRDKLGDG